MSMNSGHNGWRYGIALGSAALFFVSALFPTAAGLTGDPGSLPRWWGTADVALAFVLGLLAFVLALITQNRISESARQSTYRTYRALTHGILVLLIVFFLAGSRIHWTQCATGFAWRTWLLLYSLPAWFTLLKSR
ncbi:MAG TPA: hypothetical protein VGD59_10505 [Acidisarcina sp.]